MLVMRVIAYAAAGVFPLVGWAAMAAAGPVGTCDPVQVRTVAGSSTLVIVGPSGEPMSIRVLPQRINAIGRDDDNSLYGIAQPVGARAQFVRISSLGQISVLGEARGLGDVFVGAAHAGTLLLLSGDDLITIRIAGLVRAAPIPLSAPVSIGDWAFDPTRGTLLAVSTTSDRPALISVGVDGTVTTLGFPAGLPRGSYGAVWLDHNALFALHNESGATYRVPLDGHAATRIAAGAPLTAADAASCAVVPVPPASPSPSPISPSPVVRPPQSPSPVSPSASPSPSTSLSPPPVVAVPPRPSVAPKSRPVRVRPPAVPSPRTLVPPRTAAPTTRTRPTPQRPSTPSRGVVPPMLPPLRPDHVSPVVANAQSHAKERERSRRRVAVAAAVMTLGAVLARSRTRTR
ncbi:MAG: hypothetical protein HOV71_05615 [Hamadaea sp.]|nr:hypothetical protein [Hamadaea sp.]NUR47596.1 hypothetical protein [Hamadaea sp.]NUT06746.1 hypothetical protein [Hamadaea sp.]